MTYYPPIQDIIYLPVNAGIKIFIYMSKSNSGLYTQRLLKQSYFILMSSVIGSIFGIMSFTGFFMELNENLILKFLKKTAKIKSFLSIIFKRKEISSIHFGNVKKSRKLKKSNIGLI